MSIIPLKLLSASPPSPSSSSSDSLSTIFLPFCNRFFGARSISSSSSSSDEKITPFLTRADDFSFVGSGLGGAFEGAFEDLDLDLGGASSSSLFSESESDRSAPV